MEYIENVLVINNIDSSAINVMQFITLIMEEVEKDTSLNDGNQKKNKVISILQEFANNDTNIFIKCNNKIIIDNITTILNNELISDIIDNIVLCADGAIKINKAIKNGCFCCINKKSNK
jgi:hypothetical protein